MGNDDIRSSSSSSRDRSDDRAYPPSHLAFRLAAGTRRRNQRQNRRSSAYSIDDDLSRLELAAFALYVEAATVAKRPEPRASFGERAHLAHGLAASAVEADGDVKRRLEAFAQGVVERLDRRLESASAPPLARFSRF